MELLNTEDAARYIGLRRKTLENWRTEGRQGLRYRKVGVRVFYAREDLDAFLKGCVRNSTSDSASPAA